MNEMNVGFAETQNSSEAISFLLQQTAGYDSAIELGQMHVSEQIII
jgi:hypothetical protein